MRSSPVLALWASVAYAGLVFNAWTAELRPISLEDAGSFEPMELGGRQAASGKATFQRIRRIPGGYSVELGFENFNNDALRVSVKFDEKEVAASIAEFGLKEHDLSILDRWYDEARQNAIDRVQRKARQVRGQNERLQGELNESLDALAKEYRKRRLALYEQSGFHYSGSHVIEVDAPILVQKSVARVRALAQGFAAIARQRAYETEDLAGAVAAMVQTALRYEFPGVKEGQVTTGGVLPPLKALVLGQGDCETKAVLMGSVLKSWPSLRMVGLEIPEHYLIGVHLIPRQGEVYLDYEGLPYVMIETAGPGWLRPGTVGDVTQAYLDSGNEFKIQPF